MSPLSVVRWLTSWVAFLVAYLTFVATLLGSAAWLPKRVASHFGMDGQPDGWMHRNTYLFTMMLVGLLTGLLSAGLFVLIDQRQGKPRQVGNDPGYFFIGVPTLIFLGGVNLLVVEANSHDPAAISLLGLVAVGLVFVLLLATLVVVARSSKSDGPL